MLGRIKNIGLSWKVQLAPAFLILVLIGVGAYALQALRSNQTAVDALVAGPMRQSELANELTTTTWMAHAKLYRLAATAANETDTKKVEAIAKEASAAAAKIPEALKAVEAAQDGAKSDSLEKLKTAVAGYLKQSKNAIEMADGDTGSAMMFIKGAERNFADIDKLTDDLIARSQRKQGSRDRPRRAEARSAAVDADGRAAGGGFRRHRGFVPDRPQHFPPRGRDVPGDARTRGRQFRCPTAGPRTPRRSRPDGPRGRGIQGAGRCQGRTRDRRARGQEPRTGRRPPRRVA